MNNTTKPKAKKARKKSGPGRPHGGDSDVRERLLRTTITIAVEEGVAAVSIRRVAHAAHVSSAMVHYYFGSRDGLLDAMLESAIQPLLRSIGAWHSVDQPATQADTHVDLSQADTASAGLPSLAQLLPLALRHICQNPWLPTLVLRDVLGRAGPFRDRFIERVASRGRKLLVATIENEQAQGRIRADIDPTLTALTLLSLLVFPVLSFPLSSQLYGVSLDEAFIQRLSEHYQTLLQRGLQQ